MGKKEQTAGLMKAGELAKAAGVSVSTVKFYAKEGLIRASLKTGRNMAYYDPSCVETIQRIRKLQRERFYPLSVIKGLLENGGAEKAEFDLLDAIHKSGGETGAPRPLGDAAHAAGLSHAQAAALAEAGLIDTEGTGRRQTVLPSGQAVMALVGRRLEAGIPFEQSLRAFTIYQEALDRAAAADVDSFVAGVLMARTFTAETGANMIRVSDETLDAFIDIRRREMNRAYGSHRLEDLDRFARRLTAALPAMEAALREAGFPEAAALCADAGEQGAALPQVTDRFWGFARWAKGDIARAIAEALSGRQYFTETRPAGEGAEALASWCMGVAWLTLAPEVLDCAGAAAAAWEEFRAVLSRLGAPALADRLHKDLDGIGGTI